MAKDKITEYDATASNNTDVGGVNLAENSMNPSDVNNAIREVMSHQKEAFGSGNPLYVDQTNNRVGVNKTPTVALDVSGQAIITTTDNSSTLTLTSTDADASRGAILAINRNSASPADNDIAGTIKFNAKNDADEDIELFEINTSLTDVSDGTEDAKMTINGIIGGASTNRLNLTNSETVFNDDSVDLDFRIESNNDENCFFVNGGDDEVCVGATSAGLHKMIVKGATGGNATFKVENSSSSGNTTTYLSFMDGSGSASVNSAHFQGFNGANNHYLLGNGTTTFTSDANAKKNIETTRDGYLEDLASLRVVKYNWKEDEDGTPKELGLIAQEVEEVFPNLVMLDFDPQIPDEDKKKMIKVSVLPFMLLKALQEANTKIEALEARITALENA